MADNPLPNGTRSDWTTAAREVASTAERQHGLLTPADLRAAGIDERTATRWLGEGRLISVARGVYRVGGAPRTASSEVLAVVLIAPDRTWASHRTAAWLWELEGFGPPGRVEVTRLVGRSNGREAGTVHRTTSMPEHHVTVRHGIPVTSLARTVFDLAARMGAGPLERAVEAALRTRWCTIGALHRVTEELGGRGRPGTVTMRSMLAERGAGYVPTESELDRLGRTVVAPIGGFEWQVPISDRRGYIRRVDGLHRRARLVVEWDGAAFHSGRPQRLLDASGDARLEQLGHHVVRFGWSDVAHRPDHVRRQVRSLVDSGLAAALVVVPGMDHGQMRL